MQNFLGPFLPAAEIFVLMFENPSNRCRLMLWGIDICYRSQFWTFWVELSSGPELALWSPCGPVGSQICCTVAHRLTVPASDGMHGLSAPHCGLFAFAQAPPSARNTSLTFLALVFLLTLQVLAQTLCQEAFPNLCNSVRHPTSVLSWLYIYLCSVTAGDGKWL